MATIHYRCGHPDLRDFAVDEDGKFNRQQVLQARRVLYKVPDDVVWEPQQDVRPGESGRPEVYDLHTSRAVFPCEVCGREIRVVTDKKVR